MCAALTNDNAFDACSADRTWFSGAVIHSKVILILTAAIDPVEGRSVAANAFLQDFADRLMQYLRLLQRDRIGSSQGMQLREMQRFICIYIAEPGKESLVQQQGLEQTVFVVERHVEPFGCEAPAQGFRSKLAKKIFRIGREPDTPEFARVVEYQVAQATIFRNQAQDQPVMFFGLNFTLFDREVAAHSQVDQKAEIGQPEDEVFGAPRYVLDDLSLDQLTEFSDAGKRKRAGPAQTRTLDCLSDQVWLEFACNGFDFREFRHYL